MQVNILEAKNRLSQLIRSAQGGEEIIIANHRGEPVARLLPAREGSTSKAKTGDARAILDWLESHPLPPYARRSAEETDGSIEEERASWD